LALTLGDYVVVLTVTTDDQFVLVRQFRPAIERMTIEFPAGTVEPGETPEAAARRELAEETGFVAERWHLLGTLEPDTGRLANRLWCYLARDAHRPASAGPCEADVETLTCSRDELARWIAEGAVDHAFTLATLFLAGFHHRLPPLSRAGDNSDPAPVR
jgi:ADP-ribose pyrophosphatase